MGNFANIYVSPTIPATDSTPSLREFSSLSELREEAAEFAEAYDKFDIALYEAFSEWYAKCYRVRNNIPKPEFDTKVTLIKVSEDEATYIVHGTVENVYQEIPGSPAGGVVVEKHTKESIVKFPLAFLENKTPYLKEAEAMGINAVERKAIKTAEKAVNKAIKKAEKKAQRLANLLSAREQ